MSEPTKKYTGMILADGVLHLYESAEDLRRAMIERGRDWSQVAWLDGVVFHPGGSRATHRKQIESHSR